MSENKTELNDKAMDINEILNFLGTHMGWKIHSSGMRYEAVYFTGEFKGVYDYGAGLLRVGIVSILDYDHYLKNKDNKKHKKEDDRYMAMVTVSTIDDGVWQAEGRETFTLEDSKKELDRIYETLSEKLEKFLPSEKEFNEILTHLGYYGVCTG